MHPSSPKSRKVRNKNPFISNLLYKTKAISSLTLKQIQKLIINLSYSPKLYDFSLSLKINFDCKNYFTKSSYKHSLQPEIKGLITIPSHHNQIF